MEGYKGDIDPRVEGMTQLQISRSFVHYNLTKEEKEEDLGKKNKIVEEYITFNCFDKEEALVGLQRLTDLITSLEEIVCVSIGDGEIRVVGTTSVKIDNIEHYMYKWRSQVANQASWQKDHNEYLLLKKKFEGE